ncbi:hypothetical protein DEAC_c14400 [Desulfosporosinus acididurans]|uniref:Uncharacterized protein n=1 Tax=Desulfosporosinus acididurans TaxID=476652 RepID=A0A0J1FTZ7_9FIRM|nr:hypothetical protein [Desulfosporosinus acididurans]KLU66772.1 hypothetical protein DEAC_c14400 [Desulfosporosinus acididurans]
MTYEFINDGDTTIIKVNFSDEGVELSGETSVKGDESAAVAYLPVFESDLRRNFAEKFPVPEIPAENGGMI